MSWRWRRPLRRRPLRRGPMEAEPSRQLGRISRGDARLCRTTENMVVADTAGTIGFIAPGNSDPPHAMVGYRCRVWNGEYDWNGTIPFEALPQSSEPRSGHFASANNKIVPDNVPLFPVTGLGHPEPRRADRGTARRHTRQSADASGTQADTSHHGASARAADEPHRAGKRGGARSGGPAATWDFRMESDRGRAAVVHRMAARLRP